MILLALFLATSQAMPDLDAAIVNYRALSVEAARTGDRSFMPLAAENVCRIAYRYTITTGTQDAADAVIGYSGPDADRLKLSCSIYFQARS